MNLPKNHQAFRHWINPPFKYHQDLVYIKDLILREELVLRNTDFGSFWEITRAVEIEMAKSKRMIRGYIRASEIQGFFSIGIFDELHRVHTLRRTRYRYLKAHVDLDGPARAYLSAQYLYYSLQKDYLDALYFERALERMGRHNHQPEVREACHRWRQEL